MIAGVCGGIAEYINIDSTIVRLVWALMIFLGGTGIILYIAAAIIIPKRPAFAIPKPEGDARPKVPSVSGERFVGLALIVVGGAFLLGNLGLFHIFHIFHIGWAALFALFFIVVGLLLILRGEDKHASPDQEINDSASGIHQSPSRRLERSRFDKKLFGVCGGLAKYFDVDSTIVRIIFILLTLTSFGLGIVLYLAIAIAAPEESLFTKII